MTLQQEAFQSRKHLAFTFHLLSAAATVLTYVYYHSVVMDNGRRSDVRMFSIFLNFIMFSITF